ncbi:MAG: DUF2911 domain-containing protein [Flavobacteriaceae bacterium]
MKKLLLLCFLAVVSVEAQIKTPDLSPFSKLEQAVGLTDVTVEYSRPSMRGRTIFGGLEEYGKIWRTGANARTKISFSNDVTVGEQELKAGTYAIFTKPMPDTWEVYFYTEHQGGGTPQKWDDSKVAAKTSVDVIKMPEGIKIETFTITIDDITSNGAVIGMMWDNVYVGVPFTVPTDKTVAANIDKVMGGPDAMDYYTAATYYFNEGKDIAKAQEWVNKAISMMDEPRFWQLRQQSLILARAGDKKGAIAAAKKSLKAAQEANYEPYIKMNTESLKEWGAM